MSRPLARCSLLILCLASTPSAASPDTLWPAAQPVQGLPAPLLGPDGALWLGTLTPNTPALWRQGRGYAVVDPQSGQLILLDQDLPVTARGQRLSVARRYDGSAWRFSVNEQAETEATPWTVERGAVGEPAIVTSNAGLKAWYQYEDGQLIGVSTTDRPRVRYLYGEDGQLRGVLWADGATLLVERDAQGRVTRMAGPGPLSMELRWSDQRLELTDSAGRRLTVERSPDRVLVKGADGARVESRLESGQLVGWTDPKGARVALTHDAQGRITDLSAPGGAQWHFTWSEQGISAVTGPLGEAWTYTYDARGRLIGLRGASGRTFNLRYDAWGQPTSLEQGDVSTLLRWSERGQLEQVRAPNGAALHLRRDEHDRLVALEDESGGAIELLAFEGALPTRLRNRAGAQWILTRDRLGRWTRLSGPAQALNAVRDTLGRVTRLGPSVGGSSSLLYRGDGLLSGLVDALGARWGLLYDLGGRLSAVRAPDGAALRLDRDPLGELSALREGEDQLSIRRDTRGNPSAAGPHQWTWSSSGRLRGVQGGGISLSLGYEADELRSLETTLGSLRLRTDSGGHTTGVTQDQRSYTLSYDSSGRITAVQEPGGPRLVIQRDHRGKISGMQLGDQSWQALRDPEGRVVRWTGPDRRALSADRDEAGRLTLVRFPDGTLARREHGASRASLLIEDARGQVILDRELELDPIGRVSALVEQGQRARVHRDPLGRVTAIEQGEGAWSRSPFGFSGPEGSRASWNAQGRPESAEAPPGDLAWGLLAGPVTCLLNEQGQVSALSSDSGRVSLRYDGLGRLIALDQGERKLSVRWDPWGRPELIQDEAGQRLTLSWGPEGLLGWTQASQSTWILQEPGWGWVLPSAQSVVADERGAPALITQAGALLRRLLRTPLGLSLRSAPPMGAQNTWDLLPGGPVLDGAGGWDPLSGASLSPQAHSPWSPWPDPSPMPGLEGAGQPSWDPGPWMPQSAFSDPITLLMALGELEPALPGPWWIPSPAPPPLGGLPQVLATPAAPLMPPWGALPLDPGDPLSALALRAALPGGPAIDDAAVLQAMLSADLPPESSWLPTLLPGAARAGIIW